MNGMNKISIAIVLLLSNGIFNDQHPNPDNHHHYDIKIKMLFTKEDFETS